MLRVISIVYVIIFGICFHGPILSQVHISIRYNALNTYIKATASDNYALVNKTVAYGLIQIGKDELIIKTDQGTFSKFKIISRHNDISSNNVIFICMNNDNQCTIAYGADSKTLTVFYEDQKLVYLMIL